MSDLTEVRESVNEPTTIKGAVGFLAAMAGITVSTLEVVKLHLQVFGLILSAIIGVLTIVSLVRGLRRSADKERSKGKSD